MRKTNKIKPIHLFKIRSHQKNSFSSLFSSSTPTKGSKRIFIPGCSLSSYDINIVENTYTYLKENFSDVALHVRCCGKPSSDIGDKTFFAKKVKETQTFIESHDIEEIIVGCENCYMTYKQHLENVKIVTLWETISELKVPNHLINHYHSDKTYALHDPCPIRTEQHIHSSVRHILSQLGVSIKEFKHHKEKTICCGSDNMCKVTNHELWKKQSTHRAESTDAEDIISYCQSCVSSLSDSGKNTLHVLDFLFNEDMIKQKITTQKKINFIKSWWHKHINAKIQ